MATIKFVDGRDRNLVTYQERAKDDPALKALLDRLPPGEGEGATFTHHDGEVDAPQLVEIQMPPNTRVAPHAHATDEIIVIREGGLRFGKQVYGVGSSIFVPKMTLYSFEVGPEGVTFYNFRPTAGASLISKDDFMAMRKAGAAPEDAPDAPA